MIWEEAALVAVVKIDVPGKGLFYLYALCRFQQVAAAAGFVHEFFELGAKAGAEGLGMINGDLAGHEALRFLSGGIFQKPVSRLLHGHLFMGDALRQGLKADVRPGI